MARRSSEYIDTNWSATAWERAFARFRCMARVSVSLTGVVSVVSETFWFLIIATSCCRQVMMLSRSRTCSWSWTEVIASWSAPPILPSADSKAWMRDVWASRSFASVSESCTRRAWFAFTWISSALRISASGMAGSFQNASAFGGCLSRPNIRGACWDIPATTGAPRTLMLFTAVQLEQRVLRDGPWCPSVQRGFWEGQAGLLNPRSLRSQVLRGQRRSRKLHLSS
mmetsp:Transcript_9022/g.22276  ORF Transcript_9022/g.22276 Transcript_9022/m.22276 type:complete len:226 (-) Transcript_9022:58-735(-)